MAQRSQRKTISRYQTSSSDEAFSYLALLRVPLCSLGLRLLFFFYPTWPASPPTTEPSPFPEKQVCCSSIPQNPCPLRSAQSSCGSALTCHAPRCHSPQPHNHPSS